jgi:hypothetical protein
VVEYEGNGAQLGHYLIAWNSPQEAQQWAQGAVQFATQEKGLQVVDQGAVNADSGQVGEYFVTTDNQTTVVIWHNGNLGALVSGPTDAPVQFFNEVPY